MAYEQGSVISTRGGIFCVQHDAASASFVVSGPATGVTWPTMVSWPLSVSGSVYVANPGPVVAVFNYPMFNTSIGPSPMPEDIVNIPQFNVSGDTNGGSPTYSNKMRLIAIGMESARKAAYDYVNGQNLVVMKAEWTLQGPANKKLIEDALASGAPSVAEAARALT